MPPPVICARGARGLAALRPARARGAMPGARRARTTGNGQWAARPQAQRAIFPYNILIFRPTIVAILRGDA
ncbi:hypothetical protein BSIN_0694 [Burkholderia singularis]|uniref:Uncharacterized protein n=1 Tax=Burkholderia singularis TaxID=1503053 RepID=A0A238H9M8_9BURK|nr:hypothetical protein BSIN_0694 [Burkholderia singularis]